MNNQDTMALSILLMILYNFGTISPFGYFISLLRNVIVTQSLVKFSPYVVQGTWAVTTVNADTRATLLRALYCSLIAVVNLCLCEYDDHVCKSYVELNNVCIFLRFHILKNFITLVSCL